MNLEELLGKKVPRGCCLRIGSLLERHLSTVSDSCMGVQGGSSSTFGGRRLTNVFSHSRCALNCISDNCSNPPYWSISQTAADYFRDFLPFSPLMMFCPPTGGKTPWEAFLRSLVDMVSRYSQQMCIHHEWKIPDVGGVSATWQFRSA